MSATIVPSSFNWFVSTPGMFTITTTAPMTEGNWCRLAFSIRSTAIGASEAPKSTVRLTICVCPPPEPIAW